MRGQHLPISYWLNTPGHPNERVYLDASLWEKFVNWVNPASQTDVTRLQNLSQGVWKVCVFQDQMNRYFGKNSSRDKHLKALGVQFISATSGGKVTPQDELYLTEATEVYFGSEDPTLARRHAEFLLLARRHSANTEITLLTQHRTFWRIPRVNTYFLDSEPLVGTLDLPATFDFLSDFDIHSSLVSAVGSQISNSDHGHVMLDALIGLRDHVRLKSSLTTDGYQLMDLAFQPNNPSIKLNPLTDPNPQGSQQNEQKGYHRLACGVMTGLRNPLTHEGAISPFAQSRYPNKKTLYKYPIPSPIREWIAGESADG